MLRVLLVDDERCIVKELTASPDQFSQRHDTDTSLEMLAKRLAIAVARQQPPLSGTVANTSNLPQPLYAIDCTPNLWKNGRIHRIAWEQISCFFVMKGCRRVQVAATDQIYESNNTLRQFREKSPTQQFIRCHRSFYVNPRHLLYMIPKKNSTLAITVAGYPETIPVSRAFRTAICQQFASRPTTDKWGVDNFE